MSNFNLSLCSSGQSNPTFYLQKGGQAFVLRKKPHGPLLPRAHKVSNILHWAPNTLYCRWHGSMRDAPAHWWMCPEMQRVAGSFPVFCALHISKHSRGFTPLIYVWEVLIEPKFLCLLQVDREYHVQKALFSAGFPVPEPLLYCSDISIIGTEFYVMQHVQVGPPVWEILPFSLLLAASKSSKTVLLEPYPAQFCDMSVNNLLIFLRNASYQWFSQISASPGLFSHFVEFYSSVFNLLFLFELLEGYLEIRQ